MDGPEFLLGRQRISLASIRSRPAVSAIMIAIIMMIIEIAPLVAIHGTLAAKTTVDAISMIHLPSAPTDRTQEKRRRLGRVTGD